MCSRSPKIQRDHASTPAKSLLLKVFLTGRVAAEANGRVLTSVTSFLMIGSFEVDRVRRRSYPLDGEQDEQWWAVSHQHPICKYVEESGDFRALKVSDFLTRTQLHRLELHDHLGFDYEMMLPLRSPPWHER